MGEIKDGGFAFPHIEIENRSSASQIGRIPIEIQHSGMSLRDWFAGQALTGILANTQYSSYGVKLNNEMLNLDIACYKIADMMIKEREKGA